MPTVQNREMTVTERLADMATSSPTSDSGIRLNRRAVALLSGGLDSALAIHLVKRQGVHVTAVHFTSFFSPGWDDQQSSVRSLARQLDVPLVLRAKGDEFIQLIRSPKYGHGKNLNPCIDCRIYTFRRARELMEEIEASFLVTGEVVGQRPMSQRKDTIRLIEKQAGCDGIVVRPLSALVLPPSLPEQVGIVDREQLMDVAGRGRKVQLRMARELGLRDYSPPAGGCLLTEQVFSRRLRDLLETSEEIRSEDLELLRIGRHLRIRPGLRVVVSRNESENQKLDKLKSSGILFFPVGFPGPSALALGVPDPEEEVLIGGLVRRYAKASGRGETIGIAAPGKSERHARVSCVADDDWISDHMV